jgi:hypothetical protein
MPDIEFSISVLTLLAIIFSAAGIGYAFRSTQIRKKQLKIQHLKREIAYNHAHILEQQKEYVALEIEMRKLTQIRVLPLKSAGSDYAGVK